MRNKLLLLLCLVFQPIGAPAAEPDEAKYIGMVEQGVALAKAGKGGEAIASYLDPVVAHFDSRLADSSHVYYCSHSQQETLLYALKGAADNKDTIVLGSAWCDALYVKAFALIDLKRLDEAEISLRRALALAPERSLYLNELGHVLTARKNWAEAKAAFAHAEAAAEIPSSDAKAMKSRGCRGIGYVEVEENKLDEAEATYNRCLGIDPADAQSRAELGYIRKVRAQRKTQ